MSSDRKRNVDGPTRRFVIDFKKASEVGDTLIEVLLALTVISLTAVALLGAFTTSISTAADYKNLSTLDNVLKSFVEHTTYQLGQQPQPPAISPQFVPCAIVNSDGSGTYSSITLTQGTYHAELNGIEYWTTSSTWSSNPTECVSAPPSQELLTATVTNTGNNTSQSIQFAVSDPAFSPANPAKPTFISAASDTVSAGGTSTFAVSAMGQPTPSLSAAGLPGAPPWVTFSDQGGGNGTLVITPPDGAGSGSPYTFTLSATNSVAMTPQTFTLYVNSAPAFTSANSDTITPVADPSFTVITTGSPTPALSATGVPVPWANFVDNMNGTGTLSFPGTPAVGTYSITFSATNSAGTAQPQFFTLYVNAAPAPPAFTTATSVTVAPNEAFSFAVTATGTPTIAESESGNLPNGVTFTPGSGTGGSVSGTLSGTPRVENRTYAITFTATNGGGSTTLSFSLIVSPESMVTITSPTTASPASFRKNAGFTLIITGSGFLCSGPTQIVVTIGTNTYTPNTCSSGSLSISGTAPRSRGAYDVTVTNPDGGSATQSNAFNATN
jgi:hypothetical protein